MNDIDFLIQDLKACFFKKKGWVRSTINYDNSFLNAAEVCAELKADPVVFIEAVFKGRDASKIFPTFLNKSKDELKQIYNTFTQTSYAELEELFDLLVEKLKQQVKIGRKVEDILINDHINFPAWFRVVITKEAIPAVITKYSAQAKREVERFLLIKQLIKNKGLDTDRV